MRPLILVSTINSRHWNTCYLQLLSVQRCQHPPQAERSCLGGVGHGFRCAGGVPSSVRPLLVGWWGWVGRCGWVSSPHQPGREVGGAGGGWVVPSLSRAA